MEITSFFIKTDLPADENVGGFLRGAIACAQKDKPEFHNHVLGGGYLYRYPTVQYKIINGTPVVVAVGEAREEVGKALEELGTLRLGKKTLKVLGVVQKRQVFSFMPCKPRTYEFLTPYVALNSKNAALYRQYRSSKSWLYLKELQKSILAGNVLSLCKGLGVVVENELRARCLFEEKTIFYRGISAVAFTGKFSLNYFLPDLIGIGRGVSEGWGTIAAVPSDLGGTDEAHGNAYGERAEAEKRDALG